MVGSANGVLIVALWGFYTPLEGKWLAKKIRQKISEEVKGKPSVSSRQGGLIRFYGHNKFIVTKVVIYFFFS